jgi:meso-butanediol dehydrogenase / (S,S)-butanediol dehydrogenase / diacetyl reductase
MSPEFAGAVVLVTGAGGGIGSATVELLQARGATVVAFGPQDPRLEQLSSLDRVVTVPGDAASDVDIRRAVSVALGHGARLDAVVCCAGIGTFGDVLEAGSTWPETFRGNLETAYVTARAALPALISAGGSIVMVSSLAGTVAVPGSAAYTASKHALIGLTRAAPPSPPRSPR